MHVNAVGAHENDAREIDTDGGALRVVVDILASVLGACGDLNIPLGEGAITHGSLRAPALGDLVIGAARREEADPRSRFSSRLGSPIQDIATAHLVYTKAKERGLGVEVALPAG